MNAQQIREVAMRAESAYDRARQRVADRIAAIDAIATSRAERAKQQNDRDLGVDFVAMHLLPLFPPRGGIDLASRSLHQRWRLVRPFGYESAHRVRLGFDGMAAEYDRMNEGTNSWTMLLREGGLEFVEVDNAFVAHQGAAAALDLYQLEDDILAGLDEARRLSDEGHVSVPFALSVQLHKIAGLRAATRDRRFGSQTITISSAPIAPVEIHRWEDVDDAIRGIFHVMWQATGWDRSLSYDDEGVRRRARGRP